MVIFEQVDLPLLKMIENLFVEITRESMEKLAMKEIQMGLKDVIQIELLF